jgi:predicted heme/steroid binding protein
MKHEKAENHRQTTSLLTLGLLIIILSTILIFTSCGTSVTPAATGITVSTTAGQAVTTGSTDASTTAAASATLKEFTVDELATFDGQNGNPSYIAVDGNVYDVSNATPWKNGSHFGKYTAGKDLSKAIVLVSHGKSKLSEVPIVGTLK